MVIIRLHAWPCVWCVENKLWSSAAWVCLSASQEKQALFKEVTKKRVKKGLSVKLWVGVMGSQQEVWSTMESFLPQGEKGKGRALPGRSRPWAWGCDSRGSCWQWEPDSDSVLLPFLRPPASAPPGRAQLLPRGPGCPVMLFLRAAPGHRAGWRAGSRRRGLASTWIRILARPRASCRALVKLPLAPSVVN